MKPRICNRMVRIVGCALIILLLFTFFYLIFVHQTLRSFWMGKPELLTEGDNIMEMKKFNRTKGEHFRQELRADCYYYDDLNGLFHPDVPHPRYIVTGGAGFIGSHFVKELTRHVETTGQIKVLDNLWSGTLHNLQFDDDSWMIHPRDDFCALDLTNRDDVMKYVRGADYIYHLAEVRSSVYSQEVRSVFQQNVLMNNNTVTAAKKNGIPNFIYVGTACCFPKCLHKGIKNPDIHDLFESYYSSEPESAYSWSKLIGEYEALLAGNENFNVGILRLHNIFGPRSDFSSEKGQIIPSLIRKAINFPKEKFVIKTSSQGDIYRDFGYVDDVVRALLLVKDKGMNKGAIEIGSGNAMKIDDLGRLIAGIVSKQLNKVIEIIEIDIFSNKMGDNNNKRCISEGTRALDILGWKSKVSLREGLIRTIEWKLERLKHKRVLVIMSGEARGSDFSYKSIILRLIKPFNAHLATFFTDKSEWTMLQENAQFNWSISEPESWASIFDEAEVFCDPRNYTEGWKEGLCDFTGIWIGGLDPNCSGIGGYEGKGSGGIVFAFRWLIVQKMLSLNLFDKYDYFVMTRADHVYLCDFSIDFDKIDPREQMDGFVPEGESYGGVCDRFFFASGETFYRMMSITQQFICDPKILESERDKLMGSEYAQKFMWDYNNIKIKIFPRNMFTVRAESDPTRWTTGKYDETLWKIGKLKYKYFGSFHLSKKMCDLTTKESLENEMVRLRDLPDYKLELGCGQKIEKKKKDRFYDLFVRYFWDNILGF